MVHRNAAVRAQRVPGWLRAFILLSSLAPAAWFSLTQTGPYLWLADVQSNLLGAYYPVLTGLFVFVLFLVPAGLIVQVLASVMPSERRAESDAQAAARLARQDQAIRNLVYPIALVGLGVVALVIAAWSAASAVMMGELAAYTLQSDSEWPPPARWLALEAQVDGHSRTSYLDDNTRAITYYAALCAVDAGKGASSPCPLVAVVPERQWEAFQLTGRAEGTLGMAPSGIVRDALEDAGAHLTADARTFHVGWDPGRTWEMATIMGTVGAVALVTGLAWVWWRRRRT
jgi:hypothetical protein